MHQYYKLIFQLKVAYFNHTPIVDMKNNNMQVKLHAKMSLDGKKYTYKDRIAPLVI